MIGNVPLQLFHQLESHGFLPFQPIRVQGVEQVRGKLSHHFVEHVQAAVKVRPQLQYVGAVFQRLCQFACGNLPRGQQNNAFHSSACRIRGDRSRSVSGGGAAYPGKSFGFCHGDGRGNSRVLKRTSRIHALMFHHQARHAQLTRCFSQWDERRVAFAHCDNVAAINLGKQLVEAPDTTCIFRQWRPSPSAPYLLQAQRESRRRRGPFWINHLQQLRALRAAEHSVRGFLHLAAVDAAQHVRRGPRMGWGCRHCAPVAAERFGRRHTGMLAPAGWQNSSWTARTTSAPRAAATAKQMLSSLAPCATAITLTSRRATAEKTRPRMPHVPFIDSPSTATTAISLLTSAGRSTPCASSMRKIELINWMTRAASSLRSTNPSACSGDDCVAKSTSICSCPRRRKSLPHSSTG